ncbi:MAG: hypothetical protein M1274_12200 [Actinobacteria bacterium]|nr:hypothetical protein [Actinomycetota bacterium]
MSLLDKLTAGAERAAKEAERAFEKGKAKVGELQIEMQMDSAAKKLGYLVFDFYRGRQVDQAQRQKLLDDLSRMEDDLIKARAEAAAKAQATADTSAEGGAAQPSGAQTAEDGPEAAAAPPSEGPPQPGAEATPGAAPEAAPEAEQAASTAEAGEQAESSTGPPPNEESWPQADA